MFAFVVKRLLLTVPVLFGLLVLMFVLTRIVPIDPAAVLAGETATPEQVSSIRTELGLDKSLPVQFVRYLRQVAQGDFGTSLYTHREVATDLLQRLPATIELACFTMLISVGLGIPLGIIAAVHRNGWTDQTLRFFSIMGLAMASFWIAIILQLVFSLELGLLPLRGRMADTITPPEFFTGLYVIDYLLSGRPADSLRALSHLLLPAITLALPATATIVRFTRSSAIETLQRDFVMWERAVGYPRAIMIWKYVLRSSMSATLTQIGLLFGLFLSGSVVVEAVFAWPGLGDYLFNAVILSDYQPVIATTLLVGTVYAAVNIVVDMLQGWLDPRVTELD
jgi:peptide/nickel transport system permease protein